VSKPWLTTKQYQALDCLIEDCIAHGFEESMRVSDLIISYRDEVRPGRGHDISVVALDSDYVMNVYIDVYGNGDPPTFASITFMCSEAEPCAKCQEANGD